VHAVVVAGLDAVDHRGARRAVGAEPVVHVDERHTVGVAGREQADLVVEDLEPVVYLG
jgi:hypothetical protein